MAETPTRSSAAPTENAVSSPQLLHSQFVSLGLNSGFDYDFIDKLDSKYECSICLLALRHPTQTTCGHRFCRDCIINSMNGCNKECPIDKLPLRETDLFHDSCVEREILQLKVKCSNAALGCKFQGDLRYIEDHIHACVYQPVLCPNECSVTVLQRDLEEHLSSQCLQRFTTCDFCTKTITYSQQQVHAEECPLVSITCGLCGRDMPRLNAAEHRNLTCPFAEVSCAFIEHGCQVKGSRKDMKEHCENAVEYHIQLLSGAYKKINTLVLDLYRNMGQVAASGSFTRQPSLRSQLSQSSVAEGGQTSPAQHPERTLECSLLGAVGGGGAAQATSCTNNIPYPMYSPFDEKQEWDLDGEVQRSQQSVMDLKSEKVDLKNDLQNDLKNDLKSCKCSSDPNAVSSSSADPKHLLRMLSDKSLNINQRMMEETIRIDNVLKKIDFLAAHVGAVASETQGKFCHGTFVWKIPNFTHICAEMSKSKTVFHSTPFYSSPFGYKFCLRTNVNSSAGSAADDDAAAFLSLYIHMMRGENDDFLPWPFQGRISLSVLDCKDGSPKLHVTEHMDVSGDRDAFKRPAAFRSVKGYGFKDFIPLDQILKPTPACDYLKDNFLYTRAAVVVKSL